MKKILFLLLFPLLGFSQNKLGAWTRYALNTQIPLQCTSCLVLEGDSVSMFVYDDTDLTSPEGPDVIISADASKRLIKRRIAGAINYGNQQYYNKAEVDLLLEDKPNISGSLGDLYVPYYDIASKSLYNSPMSVASGKVGVGKINPLTTLDVNGVTTTLGVNSSVYVNAKGSNIGGGDYGNLATFSVYDYDASTVLGFFGDFNMNDKTLGAYGLKGLKFYTKTSSTQALSIDTLQRSKITSSKTGVSEALTLHNDSTDATAGRGTQLGFSAKGDTLLAAIQGVTQTTNNRAGLMKFFTANSSGVLTARAQFDQSGNLCIGCTTASEKLEINGNVYGAGNFATGDTYYGVFNVIDYRMGKYGSDAAANQVVSNHPWLVLTNNTERMRVAANGNIGFNTASPNATVDVNGPVIFRPVSAITASGYTVQEGMIVCVNTTNGTFTSTGFWGYFSGAWAKMTN